MFAAEPGSGVACPAERWKTRIFPEWTWHYVVWHRTRRVVLSTSEPNISLPSRSTIFHLSIHFCVLWLSVIAHLLVLQVDSLAMWPFQERSSASKKFPRNIAYHIWPSHQPFPSGPRNSAVNLFAGISILSCAGSCLPLTMGRSVVDVYALLIWYEAFSEQHTYIFVEFDTWFV